MKKILIIFTGGTIGSRKSKKTINVDDNSSYFLLKSYEDSELKRDVTFETLQPLNILSEDLIPGDWLILHSSLSSVKLSDYAGIIITHGTDTLPFTSAAISYMFNYIDIPIVITASNYPLEDEKSNGLRNFANSVNFILDYSVPGIFVVFENNCGDSVVHLGTRLIQAVPFTNEFDSVNSIVFGKIAGRKFFWNESSLNPGWETLKASREKIGAEKIRLSSEILYIKPHPGLNYKYYNFSVNRPKAVLHDLYHSGTACTRETDNYLLSLVDFTKYCLEKEVDVYITPIRNINGDLYLSSNKLIECGALPLQNISMEAAIVKLMLAYGCFYDKGRRRWFMNDSMLFFEYI